MAVDLEIDLEPVGLGQAEAQLLGLLAHLVVIDGESAAQNDLVQAVQRRAAEAVLLGEGGQRRGGGVGGDAEDDVVLRIDVLLQADFAAFGRDGAVGQIEIAAAGDFVGEEIAAGQFEFLESALLQAL